MVATQQPPEVGERPLQQRDRLNSPSHSLFASALIWFWITRATAEGVRWLDELLTREAEPVAHPWAYFVRGFLAVLQNDPAAARRP